MTYEIVKTKLNIPLDIGVLTDHGIITVNKKSEFDRYYCERLDLKGWVIQPIPIFISIRLKSSKLIDCSQDLQLILLDKLNQGINEIDENEIRLTGIYDNVPCPEYGIDCPCVYSDDNNRRIWMCEIAVPKENDVWQDFESALREHIAEEEQYGTIIFDVSNFIKWLKRGYKLEKK